MIKILIRILVAFAFTKYLSIGLIVAFVSLAIYILLLLIIGSKMQHEEYKESDKKEVDDLEQYVKNKDKEWYRCFQKIFIKNKMDF